MKIMPSLMLTLLIALAIAPQARAADDQATASLFNSSAAIRTLHITLSKAQWDAAQPTEERENQNGGPMRRMEYPVVHATVEFEGKTYADVGLRYKGNSSFMMARNSLKKSMKLEFNQFIAQSFYGLSSVNLNNNAGDPTQARETLGYELFAAAKVPAARTTLLRVELTVPGQYDHQFLGLYTLIEDIGKHFLKSRFGSSKGLLVKPEMARGLPYLGDKWDAAARVYAPRTDGDAKSKQRLLDFLKLIHQADDATFDKQIESMLDCDEFLRFLAVNAITSNLDSLLLSGHNFYIHIPHKAAEPIQFIPWDLNECFGGFGMGNPPETQLQLSITHPYAGENKLIERLLALPRFNERYKKIITDLTTAGGGAFAIETMNARIDALDKLTSDLRAEEKKAGINVGPPNFRPGGPGNPPGADGNGGPGNFNNPRPGFPGPGGGPGPRIKPDLKPFIAARNQSITDQLAGNSKGQIPTNRRGPGGPGGPGMRPDKPPPRPPNQ
jgi:spore coat protein CotH